MAQSRWFKRLAKEVKRVSPHLRMKKCKLGFYRIYWQNAYLHEVFEEMPVLGYDFEDYDPRLESQQYFESLEDHYELVRKLKNYKEGYYDSRDRLWKRIYLMRNNQEFNERARRAYSQHTVK